MVCNVVCGMVWGFMYAISCWAINNGILLIAMHTITLMLDAKN